MIRKSDRYTHEVIYTQSQIEEFAHCTGDMNPIHLDAEYAAQTPFKEPIVHGFLAAAVFSKVFGTLFPGEGTIYLSQQMSFLAPVYPNRRYTAHFEVIEVDTKRHNGVIATTLLDSDGHECITGEAKLKNKTQFTE